MQIFADDQETFCLVLHFLSLVATIRMYCHKLECCNTTVRMFDRDQNFKVEIASSETIRFLILR